jgi:methylenetetrahydrofolate dehydrogenase (NADP+) / methenyltetrahydrofolate cyclohydrolase
MSAKILDGTAVARTIKEEVAGEAASLATGGVVPRLDVVLVGEDPASQVYVRSKARACERAGIRSETHRLEAETPQFELESLVDRLNADPEVDGILVQLPLPSGLDSHAVLDRIDPAKDVDGFHPLNVGLLVQNRPRFVACTPVGIMELLDREGIELEGRHAVVGGQSDIVGKPMSLLLLHRHATVTICHSRTRNLAEVTRQADVLIAAAGRLALIGPEHVKPGAVVVDVGIHRLTDAESVERLFPGDEARRTRLREKGSVLSGDVDFTRVAEVAGAITPVPGGVGPLTIAMLLANTVASARMRRG